MTFQRNVGGADRIIRIVLGIGIMAAGAYYASAWGVLGIIVLATGIFRWCPLYMPLGISTCRVTPTSGEGNGDTPAQP